VNLPQSRQIRFERLLREPGASLGRLTTLYERDPTEREDLMQEIGLALWRALPGFRGDCSERTFVFRVAHNRGLSHRARRRPEPAASEMVDAVEDPAPGPEHAAERAMERDRLVAAVRRLPESLRDTVVLSLEGLTPREIGGVLGITEGNAAVRLTRARERLRELLGVAAPAPARRTVERKLS
jgi:RNA polymerase sigma factor (sigma-70 family)